jgi:uncharacterized protein with FMN-binding domain
MPNALGIEMTPDRPRPARIPVRGSLALAVTTGALVLLLSFRTPPAPPDQLAFAAEPDDTQTAVPETTVSAGASGAVPSAEDTASAEATASAEPTATTGVAPAATATPEPTAQTLTAVGDPVRIRWGTVQVSVTVTGGRIVSVEALELPLSDRRSAGLNRQAESILREEALASNSADIDVVSGATYTSLAYAQSLQSALDQLAG